MFIEINFYFLVLWHGFISSGLIFWRWPTCSSPPLAARTVINIIFWETRDSLSKHYSIKSLAHLLIRLRAAKGCRPPPTHPLTQPSRRLVCVCVPRSVTRWGRRRWHLAIGAARHRERVYLNSEGAAWWDCEAPIVLCLNQLWRALIVRACSPVISANHLP